jgi:hypothetical protein
VGMIVARNVDLLAPAEIQQANHRPSHRARQSGSHCHVRRGAGPALSSSSSPGGINPAPTSPHCVHWAVSPTCSLSSRHTDEHRVGRCRGAQGRARRSRG